MNIEPKDFLLAVLKGDLYGSTPLPLELCCRIEAQCIGQIIFERPSEAAQFCNVYSPEGWKNELDRREYLVRLHLPEKRTFEQIKKEMFKATTDGDMDLLLKLNKELKSL